MAVPDDTLITQVLYGSSDSRSLAARFPVTFFLAAIVFFVLSVPPSAPLLAAERRTEEKFVTIWSGMLPIILSAPHGGREAIPGVAMRQGVGVSKFTTRRDHNTDKLAELIAVKLRDRLDAQPFLVVARFDRKYLDVNRYREEAYESEAVRPYYETYHRMLAEACQKVRRLWGRGVLLDIHGQGAEREAIYRGTVNLKSVTDLRRRHGQEALSGGKSILGLLERSGYKIVPSTASNEGEQFYSGGYTTQVYGSHRRAGIDAIQMEFGSKLRSPANLERTANDVASAIIIFANQYLPLSLLRHASNESRG